MSQKMPDYLCFTAEQDNSTIALTQQGSPDAISLEYSLNGSTWTAYSIGTTINLASGGKVYFRATSTNSTFSKDASNYYRFVMAGQIAASGNIMSLLNQDMDATLSSWCFAMLFYHCTSLTSAPTLPATTLADSCYYYMFRDCTSLTSAPVLPATTLADSCYYYMFRDCTSLTSAPALPATALASSCYFGIFRGCTSLISAPALPATTLADSYYAYMFYGCINLNEVNVAFTTWVEGATNNWLTNASTSGTFTCPAALDTSITRGASTIPEGWTVVTT